MYATFSYNANRQRYKQIALAYDDGPVQRTTVYVDDVFEKVTESGASTFKHYIRANSELIAVQLRTSPSPLNRFLYQDHLQSTEAFAGADGAPFGRFSVDAWGARRDRDWVGPISSADKLLAWQNTNRAFTSHEQLDNLGLVHMNGRVYDPGIGRFLSADPFVMDAFNLQALNRYSYVLNNPLSFTDPSGFTPEDPFPPIDPFPSDDCGYDIFCGPPGGGGFRFPRHQPPIFTPPFGVGPGEWEAVDAVMGASRSGNGRTGWIEVRLPRGRAIVKPGEPRLEPGLQDVLAECVVPILASYCTAAAGDPDAMVVNRPVGAARVTTQAANAGTAVAREIGILRDAARGKGNFGLGSASRSEADKLGRAWVGDGYKVATDGRTLISADGLRQYRPPSFKPNLGLEQANFERRLVAQGPWFGNGHLDIIGP